MGIVVPPQRSGYAVEQTGVRTPNGLKLLVGVTPLLRL